jgi:hypothetical protein
MTLALEKLLLEKHLPRHIDCASFSECLIECVCWAKGHREEVVSAGNTYTHIHHMKDTDGGPEWHIPHGKDVREKHRKRRAKKGRKTDESIAAQVSGVMNHIVVSKFQNLGKKTDASFDKKRGVLMDKKRNNFRNMLAPSHKNDRSFESLAGMFA